MGEYVKPWRRKIGVLTMVMSCAFLGLWVRSLCCSDSIIIPLPKYRIILFDSLRGRFYFQRVQSEQNLLSKSVWTTLVPPRTERDVSIDETYNTNEWRINFGLLEIGRWRNSQHRQTKLSIVISYWSIVIPLTLFSAFLLLRKPRESIAKEPA